MNKGNCLCGAVEITLNYLPEKIGACHCATCRKINGGGVQLGIHGDADLKAKGTENIQRYTSSDWAERGFCKICGTTLFYHLTVGSMDYIYSAGLFPEQTFIITEEIFVESKPAHIGFLSDTSRKKTAQQVG
ncbi:GFA family protein [Maritalea mediterranea]|uniref:GFA family protein n=1 Tax=Maritalea mediterranea TaxID=2909667 RepID=A0ABS9E297_9HYPH|nr:GFA family protein [Maritalea mediterranea]MCF4096979.1 GFA family protein [Maritalea mediterranea]